VLARNDQRYELAWMEIDDSWSVRAWGHDLE